VQIREQRARKQQEKEARQRQELRDDERLAAYNPFGRGGGGAPLRNAHGQVITDLKANLRDINSDEPISSQQAQLHLANQVREAPFRRRVRCLAFVPSRHAVGVDAQLRWESSGVVLSLMSAVRKQVWGWPGPNIGLVTPNTEPCLAGEHWER
jgi:hypothetical protein